MRTCDILQRVRESAPLQQIFTRFNNILQTPNMLLKATGGKCVNDAISELASSFNGFALGDAVAAGAVITADELE
jgi:hypothetical protein